MRTFLLFFFIFTCSQQLRAQLLFTTLKPSDGLSSRETRCVFRDSEGYVWIGTNNGLNRFDGAHVRLWNKLSSGYPDGLGEIITAILEHKKGKIWFGTNAGIGILDKASGQIEEVKISATANGQKLSIGQLKHDGEGRLWVNTSKGLLVEKGRELVPVSQVYPFARELDDLSFIQAAFVFDAKRNCFWMGTSNGLYCLDLTRRQVFSAANNPDKLSFFTTGTINAMAQDEKGNLWFSDATKAALCYYDFGTKTLQEISAINNNAAWKLDGGCNTLFTDRQGRLWISTWLYSAFIRHSDGRFEELPYKREMPQSIGYGFFSDAHQDKYGNVWLATINGLSKLGANEFVENIVQAPSYKFYLSTGFANINTVQTDNEGIWWLGKMEGLVKYDPNTKVFERFAISETDLRGNEIFDIKLVDGELWCATGNGVHIFNPATKRYRPFNQFRLKKKAAVVPWLLQDRNGFVWVSVWGEGVYRVHPKTGEAIHFNEASIAKWGNLRTRASACAFETRKGRLWIAAGDGGVRIFDAATQKFTQAASPLLSATHITSITEDAQKNIWLASVEHGILKCTQEGLIVDSISRKNGLPLNSFADLQADELGRLWTVSRENLLCILPDRKEVTKVEIPANFSFNDHWNSLLKKGPLLYATMLDNVVVINTQRYQQLPQHASPLISSFQVSGKEMPLQQNSVQLNSNQNFFSFDFASPFHREALSMQYAYKLENFDADWVYCGRNLTASYTNVPDGEYRFLVRTTDERGKWMDEMSVVNISIRAPYWKQWWFITLLALAFAFGIYLLFRFRQRQKRNKRMDETIDYFANSEYGENSVTEICWDIARNCISHLKLEDCVVYLIDEKQNVLVQKAAYGPKNPKEHEIINPIDIPIGEGIVGTAATTGKVVLVKDTTKDARYIVDDQKRLSELAVPIIHEGKTIGVIDSEHTRRNFFKEQHVKVLSTIAAISASKIAEAKAEEAAKESQIQLLEIKKLLAESQLMALRAQMNPHFVFNCLNSIQECIVTQKYGEASLYLNKFAKLFRTVLNNSGKVMVTLAEEIEVLDLYLALEHMRFEQSFTYTIHTDEELEADEILIPSMLLQPFVENALWHGLMHKEGSRNLCICFRRKTDAVFECVIEDNGIGREKALQLKAQQSKTKRHVSRGMTICKDRIDLLQKQGQHASLQIIDKVDDAGNATGTKVVVELSAFLE
ncbi:MAG TPA: two-component regulator propeller domain-containing protein [Flavisolibacter sp.]|nr:two-component regulator propeller domain-containing protein [Flavisolibacter sp.]